MTPKKTRSEGIADDLRRIPGVGPEYSDLLESAGVDTVRALRRRNAAKLSARLAKENQRLLIVRRVPSQSTVERWIDRAEALEPSPRFGIHRASKIWATQNSRLRDGVSERWAAQNSKLRAAREKLGDVAGEHWSRHDSNFRPARMPRDDR